ncbi:hypothetical protein SAMN05216358_4212 [Rhizobium sp. AN5]|uniref:hypothetical protein n=1 Tax=Rhizobium sp. AN5 TaxID=1855304 RepID=UPI000BD9C063|nr:hypothetical protein [Rhizobium sp. AN5]SOC94012.1 hypothetical protein SAMN05216358_4212 [Rhizobium sp. AN5]
MPTFEIMGPDGRKHLVQAESQPKALAQFHSLAQQPTAPQPQQTSGNWWEAAPLVEAPRRDDGGADIFAGGAQQAQQPERMKQLETALINADQAGDTEAAKVLAAEIQKGRSAQPGSPDLDKIKRNVTKMAGMNAPVEDIDGYIASEGVTVDAVRNHKPSAGPWTKYQQPETGPWTKFQGQPVTEEMRQGAHDELLRRGAMAEIERRRSMSSASHPSFEESQALLAADARPQRFQMEVNGQRYEIEAPDEQAAIKAAEKVGGGSQRQRMEGASGGIGATLTGFADGVPVVGPALLGAGQRGAAIASTIINGGTYDENLKLAQGITQDAQDAHPWLTTGANVAGAVAGTAPLIAAAPAAFGAGSGGLMARSGASALSGSVLGGTDAAVRSGGDIEKTSLGAGMGFGLGAIGPATGGLIGAGARKLRNAFINRSAAASAGTTPKVVRGLADLAARDGLDANALRSALDDLGPEAMLMDIGPGLQGRAGGIAATPGRGQAVIRGALAERQAGANARIGQVVDETLGPNVVPSQVEAGIKGNQRNLGALYDEAFRGAKAVDTRPIAEGLEAQAVNLRGDAQTAVQRVRSMLDINGAPGNLDPNPSTLFQTRQAIDGMMASEANPQVIRALTNARAQIDDELARTVPNLKAVDASYAELARQREALARGQTILDSKRTSPRPSELAAEVLAGAEPQGLQIGPSAAPFRMSQGARAEVDRILGNNANDISALNKLIKTEGDWNRSRLATLFGEEKAGKLFKALEAERVFADTNSTVTRNSETARRALAAGEGQTADTDLIRQAAAVGGITAVPRAMAIKAGDRIFNALMSGRKEALESGMSEVLSSRNRAILEALRTREALPTSDQRVNAITRALLTGTSLLPAR